jgi:hypothetical protein
MRRPLVRSTIALLVIFACSLGVTGVANATTASPDGHLPAPPARVLVAEEQHVYLAPAAAGPQAGNTVLATCILYNNLWFYPDTLTVEVWANTECDMTVASISHAHEIQRSRWYGWETMASRADPVSDVAFNTSWFGTKLTYACGGTGIHDYRAGVAAVVLPYGGSELSGSVVTRINEVNCF